MSELRLVIFDVDGTLLDSAAYIIGCARSAFATVGLPEPSDDAVRAIIGLELGEALDRLAGGGSSAARIEAMIAAYREAAFAARARGAGEGETPLFPGARAALERLHADPPTLLGVATGKARRGLDVMLDGHGLRPLFVTTQCASEHPGKPHPAMIEAALRESGVSASRAAMVGDTTYDMEMARNAGVAAVGVAWGSHAAEELMDAGAREVIDGFAALDAALAAAFGA